MIVYNMITKKPIFGIGVLMMTVLVLELHRRGEINWFERKGLNPTSCSAAIVPLKKRLPKNWEVFCEKNNMAVITDENKLSSNLNEMLVRNPKLDKKIALKKILYNQMANHLMYLAQTTPQETLSRVMFVRVKMIHDNITINALTEGQYVARLKNLTKPSFIAQHLKSTVQVQEVLPK